MKRVLIFCWKCKEYSLIGPNEKCAICDNDVKVDWEEKQYEKDFRWAYQTAQRVRREQEKAITVSSCRSIPYVEFQPVVQPQSASNQENSTINSQGLTGSQHSNNGSKEDSREDNSGGSWDTVSRTDNDEELDLGSSPGPRVAELLREAVQFLDRESQQTVHCED